MFAAPLRRWFSLALFLGVFAGLVGTSLPALAAVTRTVSVAVRPAAVVAGGAVTFSGAVSASPVGSPVQVQRRSGDRWIVARSTSTTTSAGAYRAAVTLPKISGVHSYRVVALTKGNLRTAASRTVKVTALRPVKATIRATPTRVSPGQAVTLRGTVKPFVRRTTIAVQRLTGGRWVSIGSATLTSTGTWSRVVKPSVTSKFRAFVPRRGMNAPAVSGATTVGVLVPPRVTTTSLPTAAQAFPYHETLAKVGGAGTWSIASGFLPFGMTLGASTGVISGTPTAIETATFTVRFAESATRLTDTQTLSIKVVASSPPSINTQTLQDATKRSPYSAQLVKTGATGTWSLLSGTLPTGLALNKSTGEIAGTPILKTSSPASFTVKFTETGSGLTDTQPLTLTVLSNPPVVTTAALPNAKQGQAYSTQLAATPGRTGSWSLDAGPLPAGITLSQAGVLSGTPTVNGSFPLTVRFTENDIDAEAATKALTLTVNAPDAPEIVTTTLPDGKVAQAYSVQLQKTGLAGTWSVVNGTVLPNGLTLSSAGLLSGTPNFDGDFAFMVRFTETSSGLDDTQSLSLKINPTAAPTITTTSVPVGDVGTPYSKQLDVEITEGNPAGTWAVTGGDLPDGVTLSTSGLLSGTPTEYGSHTFTVTFTQTSTSLSDSQLLVLRLRPRVTTTVLPDGTTGQAYSQQLAKNGTAGTWAVTTGALPNGVSLSSGGLLSGTPTAVGDFGFTVEFTETASGLTDTQALTVHVDAGPPSITTTTVPNLKRGVGYSAQLQVAGNPAGTWSVIAGSLPAGITLSQATGVLSGTPTVDGAFQITVQFTETATTLSDTQVLNLTVEQGTPPTIATSFLPEGIRNQEYSTSLTTVGNVPGTWSQTGLPAGLTLSTNGIISGTPTGFGNFNVSFTFLSSVSGLSTTKQLNLHIAQSALVVIQTDSLPNGKVGQAYDTRVDTNAGAGVWSVSNGSLPNGLSIVGSTGRISGTPTVPGTFTFTVRYFTLLFGSDERVLSITVAP